MIVKPPVRYAEGNIVFAHDDKVYSYYKVHLHSYDFLGTNDKLQKLNALENLFWQTKEKMHILVLPVVTSIREQTENYKRKVFGPLKEVALQHLDRMTDVLEESLASRVASEFEVYIGVELPDMKHVSLLNEAKKKKNMKEILQFFLKTSKRYLEEMSGTDELEILKEEFERCKNNEVQVYKRLTERLKTIDRVDAKTIQWLIRRNWYRGMGEIPIIQGWKPEGEQTEKGIRPKTKDIITLMEGPIDESYGRYLSVEQLVNGKVKKTYSTFLTISSMPDRLDFPGDEWLYRLQTLDFPVEVSMRTVPVEYKKVMSKLRNMQKELRDQERHAYEAGTTIDLDMAQSMGEIDELLAEEKKTKMPFIHLSVVLCITVETEEQLHMRVQSVKDMYQDMLITIEQPYGDQFFGFMEFLPGSKQYITDYKMMVEPSRAAGSMFTATNSLGDEQGFFIGWTGVLEQPVLIQPDLAILQQGDAKTYSSNTLFCGDMGMGKSYAANVITYLTILSGAKTLILCPKGERGSRWKEHLTTIASQLNVITLSDNEADTGKLDPFLMYRENPKEATLMVIDILSLLLGIKRGDNSYRDLKVVVSEVAQGEAPSTYKVVETMVNHENENIRKIGKDLEIYRNLGFGHLIIGDGIDRGTIATDKAVTIIEVQNLMMPPENKSEAEYNESELLSVAIMYTINAYAIKFVKASNKVFTTVVIDEAWSLLQTNVGKQLAKKLERTGRALKAALYFITQNPSDIDDEMKEHIGMKFIFGLNVEKEIRQALRLLNLEDTFSNRTLIQNLKFGQCLFQDIRKRVGLVYIDSMFKHMHDAFFTTAVDSEDVAKEEQQAQETAQMMTSEKVKEEKGFVGSGV